MTRYTENVDLHCHTLASDGQLAPLDLVNLAAEKGVTLLAITDHDNADGYREAADAIEQGKGPTSLKLVSGVEFSTLWRGMNIHIVGLGVDVNCEQFLLAERQQANARAERGKMIAERLAKRDMVDVYPAAMAHAASAEALGRPHFAKALIELGYVSNFETAFKKWLGAGKIGDVKVMWPSIYEAVEWIVNAGGIAVLAHPLKYKMTRTKLLDVIGDFCEAGGRAIEVAGCQQSPDEVRYLARIANQFNLMGSRGSDFHGSHIPWNLLGKANCLPDDVRPVWAELI